jgi:polyferredoxin
VLVAVPAFLPLAGRLAHLFDNLTLFAQFAFWGVWWPFVLLSMVLVGRSWCGLFCPEGALTEAASRFGRGHAIPHWITWKGWPFVAFALTTIYGQMVSVYQYPKPALLILGGSTLGAIVIGYLYGRNHRVWCRYLCPVNGVFGLLAKLAPVYFGVDEEAWAVSRRSHNAGMRMVNCAPLVAIKTMRGASECHMCGRCSGFRGAISLSPRAPNHEIVHVAGTAPKPWETMLIVFGLMGIAAGAFHWSVSPWFIALKQAVAGWLIDHQMLWPLRLQPPWWILTDYPPVNDQMTFLDGGFGLYWGDRDCDRRAGLIVPVACRPQPWTIAACKISSFRAKPHSHRGLWRVSWAQRYHRNHVADRGPRTRIRWAFAGFAARRRHALGHCPWLEDRGAFHRASLAPLRGNPFDCYCRYDRCGELGCALLGLAMIESKYSTLALLGCSRNAVEDIGERGPCRKRNAGGVAVARQAPPVSFRR